MLENLVLIIFLDEYRLLYSEKVSSQKVLRDFAYTIYDLLDNGFSFQEDLQTRLEKIAQEALLSEKQETSKLIEEILLGNHKELWEKVRIWILPFKYSKS